METWHVALLILIQVVLFVANYVTTKNQTVQNTKDIDKNKTDILDKLAEDKRDYIKRIEKLEEGATAHNKEDDIVHGKIFDKIDEMNKELSEHKIRLGNAVAMEQVRAEFISKDYFNQFEKSVHGRIDTSEKHIMESISVMGKQIKDGFALVSTNQMALEKEIKEIQNRRRDDK